MKLLDKLLRNENNEQSYSSICTADQNKPECSLIEELRELQNKKDKLKNQKSSSIGVYPMGYYHCIYGIRLDEVSNIDKEKAFKLLKDAIKEEEIYLKNEKEIEKIDNRIKEIKQQLGIK